MKAIILAAGCGKRLLPLTNSIPKPLIELKGKPIILHQIDTLNSCGIDDIVVVTGYQQEKLIEILPKDVKTIYNEKYAETNSIYSLWLARDFMKEDILLLNADVVFSKSLLKKVLNSDFQNVISVDTGKQLKFGELNVVVNKDKRIKRISLDVPVSEAHGESTQIIKLNSRAIEIFRKKVSDCIDSKKINSYPVLELNEIIDKLEVYAIDVTGEQWIEIDNHEDLKTAQNMNNLLD